MASLRASSHRCLRITTQRAKTAVRYTLVPRRTRRSRPFCKKRVQQCGTSIQLTERNSQPPLIYRHNRHCEWHPQKPAMPSIETSRSEITAPRRGTLSPRGRKEKISRSGCAICVEGCFYQGLVEGPLRAPDCHHTPRLSQP